MTAAFRFHRVLDQLSGALLCSSLVFAPWAFGTTQPWSISTMNGLGMALGLLLAGKVAIRALSGPDFPRAVGRGRWVVTAAAILTVLVLAWCLTSAVNAKAQFSPETGSLVYSDHYLAWLPHSYDAPSTWAFFWKALALACFFWAARDWMVGPCGEPRSGSGWDGRDYGQAVARTLPKRGGTLRWLPGVKTIAGAKGGLPVGRQHGACPRPRTAVGGSS